MATLNISSITHSSFSWSVSGLSSPWNSTYFQKIVICTGTTTGGSTTAPSGILGTIYPPTSGTNTYTPTHSVSGLTASKSYTLYSYSLAQSGKWYLVQSKTITTSSPPIPSTPTWYSYSAGSSTQANLDWNAVSNATYYEVNNSVTGETKKVTDSLLYWSGLQPSTKYGFRVRAGNSYGVSAWSSYIYVTTLAPPIPSVPSWYAYSANSPYQVTLDWTASTNSTYYEVYNSVTGETKTFTDSFCYWTGLSPNTKYGFRVRAGNSYGVSAWTSYIYVTTEPLPIPATPEWYDYGVSSPTQVFLDWTTVDDATYYEVYNGTTNETRKYTTSYAYWDKLLPNKNYGFCVRAGNDNGVSAWSSYVWITTPLERPADWAWTSTIASGSSFNISANEWNSFTARINAFRQYKGLSTYGFTQATSGSPFYAYMFNQAITAIKEMSPPSGVGVATQSSGNTIYAWYFTNLRDSLNSIK